MCRSDEEKMKLEEVVLVCLRCDEYEVLELILDKILDRRKLIDWKVCSVYVNKNSRMVFDPKSAAKELI